MLSADRPGKRGSWCTIAGRILEEPAEARSWTPPRPGNLSVDSRCWRCFSSYTTAGTPHAPGFTPVARMDVLVDASSRPKRKVAKIRPGNHWEWLIRDPGPLQAAQSECIRRTARCEGAFCPLLWSSRMLAFLSEIASAEEIACVAPPGLPGPPFSRAASPVPLVPVRRWKICWMVFHFLRHAAKDDQPGHHSLPIMGRVCLPPHKQPDNASGASDTPQCGADGHACFPKVSKSGCYSSTHRASGSVGTGRRCVPVDSGAEPPGPALDTFEGLAVGAVLVVLVVVVFDGRSGDVVTI